MQLNTPGLKRLLFLCLVVLLGDHRAEGQQDAAPSAPTVSGYWMRLLGDHLAACGGRRTLVWVWRDDPPMLFPRGTVTEALIDSVPTPFRIGTVYPSDDCTHGWVVSSDLQSVMEIQLRPQERAEVTPPALLGTTTVTIKRVIPDRDGSGAWISLEPKGILRAVMEDGRLRIRQTDATCAKVYENDYASRPGHALWIVPDDDGLVAVSDSGCHYLSVWRRVNFQRLTSFDSAHFVLAIPDKAGVYLATSDGRALNGGAPYLQHCDVKEFSRGQFGNRVLWLTTVDDEICGLLMAGPEGRVVMMNHGDPINDSSGVLTLTSLRSIGTNSAYAMVERASYQKDHKSPPTVYRLTAREDGVVEQHQIFPEFYGRRGLTWIAADYESPDRVWFLTNDYLYREVTLRSDSAFPILQTPRGIRTITYSSNGRYWFDSYTGAFIEGLGGAGFNLNLNIGGLSLSDNGAVASPGIDILGSQHASVSRRWNAAPDLPPGGSEFVVQVFGPTTPDSGGKHLSPRPVRSAVTFSDSSTENLPVALERADLGKLPSPSEVRVSIKDGAGSDIRLRWEGLVFPSTVLSRLLDARPVRAALILLLPIIGLSLLAPRSLKARAWIPTLIFFAGLLTSAAAPHFLEVSPLDLVVAGAALGAALAVAGLYYPPLFRELATLQPYTSLLQPVLTIPRVRKAVFAGHVRQVVIDVAARKEEANRERFVELPLRVDRPGLQVEGLRAPLRSGWKLEDLTGALNRPDTPRLHVVIAAPGGRGKSALLHELITQTAGQWVASPRGPLPLVIAPAALLDGNLRQVIHKNMGRFAVPNVTDVDGQALTLFIDGLSESQVDSALLESLLRDCPDDVRICATTRPRPEIQHAFLRTGQAAVVEPERLDSTTLGSFVRAYIDVGTDRSAEPAGPPKNGDPEFWVHELERVFGKNTRTYLPLVVRLALQGSSDSIDSLMGVYEATLERLLGGEGKDVTALIEAAATLAIQTYWKNKERVFAFDRSEPERAMLDAILLSGLLISADRTAPNLGAHPRQVRFFHDSMQSFLVARALSRESDWDFLLTAAGDPAFRQDSADLARGVGSEVFQMCLEVFSPLRKLRETLRDDLRQWADTRDASFSVSDIISAMPEGVTRELNAKLSRQSGARTWLLMAIDICFRQDEETDTSQLLGALYHSLAPRVWDAAGGNEESAA